MGTRLIVVLGMHRSGTSAISRGLVTMGVELGDRLMPPHEKINAKGFWEDLDIYALNVEMLNAIGTDWFHASVLDAHGIEQLIGLGFDLRATELLRRKTQGLAIFGFKDPRLGRLLPFWKRVFQHEGYEASYVLALRNPLSVVASLEKRDAMDRGQAYLLWLTHTLNSLKESEGYPRVLVDFDALMRSPKEQLQRIAAACRLEAKDEAIKLYVSEFLEEGLRHTEYLGKDLLLDPTCPRLVVECFSELAEVATEKIAIESKEFMRKTVAWIKELDRLRPLLGCVDRLVSDSQRKQGAVSARDGQIGELQQTLSGRDVQISELQSILAERDSQIGGLRQVVSDREAEIGEFRQMFAERDGQIAQAQQALVVSHGQIDELRQELTIRNDQIGSLHQIEAERKTCIEELQQAVVERDGQISALHTGITEREAEIGRFQQLLTERDGQIVELRQVVVEREGQIVGLQQLVAEREAEIGAFRQLVADRDALLSEQRQVIEKHDRQIDALQKALAVRDEQLEGFQQTVAARELQIHEMQVQVVERDAKLGELGQTVAEREAQVGELQLAFTERDRQISALQQKLTESNAQIGGLQQVVAERDQNIGVLDARIRQALFDADELRKQFDHELHVLRREMEVMQCSVTWKLGAPLRAMASLLRKRRLGT